MARKAANEIAAGIFVLAGLAAGLGVILWLGSKKVLEKPQSQAYFYRDYKDGPTGLGGGSKVQVNDNEIGRIAYIKDQPERQRSVYVVNLTSTDRQLHPYGTASVPFVMVGDSLLSVRSLGDPNFGPTTEDSAIPISGGLQAIMDAVTEATDSLKKASASLNRQLDADQPGTALAKMHGILNGAREIVGNIVCVSAAIRRETDANLSTSFLSRLDDSVATLNRVLRDAEAKVSQTLTDVSLAAGHIRRYADANLASLLVRVHDISTQVLRSAQNLAELSEKARGVVDRNSASLDEVVQNFVMVSANLKATAAEVRRNPWRLLYRPDEKELHSANILDAARAFTAGAEQLDDAVTRLRSIDPKTASPDDLKRIRDRLQESFEKFMKTEQALLKEFGKDE